MGLQERVQMMRTTRRSRQKNGRHALPLELPEKYSELRHWEQEIDQNIN